MEGEDMIEDKWWNAVPHGKYKVLHEFTILYEGWEMDNEGWVVIDENSDLWIKQTSHGRPFYLRGDKAVESLVGTIAEHEIAISGQKRALDYIRGMTC